MLISTNPAGYKFVWPEGSDIIEVFRPGDPTYAPFEAVRIRGGQSQEALNRVANESPEYAKLY
jgi:hypothetical protein